MGSKEVQNTVLQLYLELTKMTQSFQAKEQVLVFLGGSDVVLVTLSSTTHLIVQNFIK